MNKPFVVLAPTGADAMHICGALGEAGIDAKASPSLEALCSGPLADISGWIIADEAIPSSAAPLISEALARQPVWSSLPIVLLTSRTTSRLHEKDPLNLANDRCGVIIVERPCRPTTLLSAVRIALRLRHHQEEVRGQIEQQSEQAGELARSNKDLEDFSSVASHDLKEPLRTITSYVTLLERRNRSTLDERSREYMKAIVSGTERMQGLIEAILGYAKVGRSEPARTRFASAEAIGEALHNLELKVAQADAHVRVDSLPVIEADRVLVVQLFQNLISNALTYRRETPRIAISCVSDEHEHRFMVEDNGIGIEAEHLQRVFVAFQRLHGSGQYPGHGIGLATCARIVEAHGGRIWVVSEVGVGSRFYISLPR